MNSERQRTGTMMTQKTLQGALKEEFEGLIEQSRKYLDELKFMENEREIAMDKGEDDAA